MAANYRHMAALRIDLVATTADFRRPDPRHPLPLNNLPDENPGTAGRIGEVRLAFLRNVKLEAVVSIVFSY